ncbi:MAG: TrkH family potassium uptake protein, partial [Methylotetracoccus sp.]|nr:TrkH family potassium uptake protein [Methylotetracoccus sp.]
MTRLLTLIRVFGAMLLVYSVADLLPILCSLIYRDGTLALFVHDMAMTAFSGLVFYLIGRPFERELKTKDGFLVVVMAWTGMAAFSTYPLMAAIPDLSFTDAYFETMSGLSTTGATVLTGLDQLPPSVNLWRHELNWLGGMGIIVLAVAILPVLGVGGRQMFMAETPGPMKDSKLTPRITETAKNLWLVYAGITAACVIALKLAGMTWFDAVCHAFSAMSLGGFSTHDASVGYFNSPAIEFVLIVFMLIAGMNFATHFLALHARNLSPYRHDIEAVPFVVLVLGSCVGITWYLWNQGTYLDFWTALRHTSFNLVSMATDCGFASVDFNQWPVFAPLWMLFLSCICVSTGSTGGGIKLMRTLILIKQSQLQMFLLTHPVAVNPLKVGRMVIPENIILSVLGFIFVDFMSIVILTLL